MTESLIDKTIDKKIGPPKKGSNSRQKTPAQVAHKKPRIQNPDGSFSTERTITVGLDGKYYNVPTIVEGKQVSRDKAIKAYNPEGKPSYDTVDEAVAAAKKRSEKIGEAAQGGSAIDNAIDEQIGQVETQAKPKQEQQQEPKQRGRKWPSPERGEPGYDKEISEKPKQESLPKAEQPKAPGRRGMIQKGRYEHEREPMELHDIRKGFSPPDTLIRERVDNEYQGVAPDEVSVPGKVQRQYQIADEMKREVQDEVDVELKPIEAISYGRYDTPIRGRSSRGEEQIQDSRIDYANLKRRIREVEDPGLKRQMSEKLYRRQQSDILYFNLMDAYEDREMELRQEYGGQAEAPTPLHPKHSTPRIQKLLKEYQDYCLEHDLEPRVISGQDVKQEAKSFSELMTMAGTSPYEILPVFGQIVGAYNTYKLYSATKALQKGDATGEQKQLIENYLSDLEELSKSGATSGAQTGKITALAVPFMVEFLLTGGAAKALSAGAKKSAKAVVKRMALKSTKGLARKSAKLLAKAAATRGGKTAIWAFNSTASVWAPRVFKRTFANMTPGMALSEDGDIVVVSKGDNPYLAFAKGFADVYTEALSEASGYYISKAVGKAVAPAMRALGKMKGAGRFGRLLKVLAKAEGKTRTVAKYGYHGMLEEYSEEELKAMLDLTMGLQSQEQFLEFHSPKNVRDTMQAFAIMGAIGLAPSAAAKATDKIVKTIEKRAKKNGHPDPEALGRQARDILTEARTEQAKREGVPRTGKQAPATPAEEPAAEATQALEQPEAAPEAAETPIEAPQRPAEPITEEKRPVARPEGEGQTPEAVPEGARGVSQMPTPRKASTMPQENWEAYVVEMGRLRDNLSEMGDAEGVESARRHLQEAIERRQELGKDIGDAAIPPAEAETAEEPAQPKGEGVLPDNPAEALDVLEKQYNAPLPKTARVNDAQMAKHVEAARPVAEAAAKHKGQGIPVRVDPQTTEVTPATEGNANATARITGDVGQSSSQKLHGEYGVQVVVTGSGTQGRRMEASMPADAVNRAMGEGAAKEKPEEPAGQAREAAQAPGEVANVDPSDIAVNAQRFQFKEGMGEAGASGLLRGVKKFDKQRARVIQVWVDPADGKTYVVNGHHRLELAKRTGAKSVNVQYIEADNAAEARLVGAMTNIAEGRGTAIDAAKIFRESGKSREALEDEGMSMREANVRDGLALARLSDELFEKVTTGEIAKKTGIAIGQNLKSKAGQEELWRRIKNRKTIPKAEEIAELARFIESAPTATEGVQTLFGEEQVERSFAFEKAKISAWVKRQFAKDKHLFKRVSRDTAVKRLEEEGSQIDKDRAEEVGQEAATAHYYYEKLSGLKGPLSTKLNKAAEELGHGGNELEIKKRFYREAKQIIRDTVEQGKAQASDEAGKTEPGSEQADTGRGQEAEEVGQPAEPEGAEYTYESIRRPVSTSTLPSDYRDNLIRMEEGGQFGRAVYDRPLPADVAEHMGLKLVEGPQIETGEVQEAAAEAQAEQEEAEGMREPEISENDIDYEIAKQAHANTSHTPEDRARTEQERYVKHMQAVWEDIRTEARKGGNEEQANLVFSEYQQKFIEKYQALLRSRQGLASTFITGRSNFPVSQQRKRQSSYDKKMEAFLEWDEKAQKKMAKELNPTKYGVSADREDAPDLIRKQIATAEKLQNTMKRANKIIRRKGGTKEDKIKEITELPGLGQEQAEELFKEAFTGDLGFPSFMLKNNNAKIRRLKRRLEQIEQMREQPVRRAEFEGGTVEENPDNNRLQIFFDAKPPADMRKQLKKNGFRWAPSEEAWQRKRSNAAIHAAEKVLGVKMESEGETEAEAEQFRPIAEKPTKLDMSEEAKSAFNAGWEAGAMESNPYYVSSPNSDAYLLGAYIRQQGITGDVSKSRGYNWKVGNRIIRVEGADVTVVNAGGGAARSMVAVPGQMGMFDEGEMPSEPLTGQQRALEIDKGETTEPLKTAKPELVKEFAKIVSKKGGPNSPKAAYLALLEKYKGKTKDLFRDFDNPMPEAQDAFEQAIKGGHLFGGSASGAMAATKSGTLGNVTASNMESEQRGPKSMAQKQKKMTVGEAFDVIGNVGSAILDPVREIIAPGARPAAKGAALRLRKVLAENAQKSLAARNTLRRAHRKFAFMSAERINTFIDRMESGQRQETPELDEIAASMRKLLDGRREKIQNLGKGFLQNYYENYFPHIWKQPDKARTIVGRILGRRPLSGPKSFLKRRDIVTVKEGLAAGLELVSDNPVDLVLLKLHEMDRFLMAQNLVKDLKERGMIKFVYARSKPPDGYVRLQDNAFQVFLPPDVGVQTKEAYDELLVANLSDIAQSLGITHERVMRIRGKAWGKAEGKDNIVTQFAGPEPVITHEIGHILGYRYGLMEYIFGKRQQAFYKRGRRKGQPKRTKKTGKVKMEYVAQGEEAVQTRKTLAEEWRKLADLRLEGQQATEAAQKYVRKGAEKEAVLLQAMIHAPEKFQEVAPTLYKRFHHFLNSHPELRPLLDLKPSLVLGESEGSLAIPGVTKLGAYYAPDPIARLVNNHLSPGLRNNSNRAVAGSFNLLRRSFNSLNMVQLSFSLFHMLNTGFDSIGTGFGLGVRQILTKKQRIKGLANIATSPLQPLVNLWRGGRMKKAFGKDIEDIQDPRLKRAVKMTVMAGGRAEMDSMYKVRGLKALSRTWQDILRGTPKKKALAFLKLPFNIFGATVESASYPVMQWWVPRLKLGVFYKLAEHEMQRAQDYGLTEEQFHESLARAWDSVDNRMGELIYDNLFWNKVLKDALMLSQRSVGWNLGSIREFAGAPIDLAKTPWRMRNGDAIVSHKMAYVIGLTFSYATSGAVLTYLLTGAPPDDLKDYFFPSTGRELPDGSKERLNLPTYSRDIYGWVNKGETVPGSVYKMVKGKMHPMWALIAQTISNEDFFGTEIRDPDDPLFEQMKDTFAHIVKQYRPISVQNYVRMEKKGADKREAAWVSMTGITAAPTYIRRTDAHKLMVRYIIDKIPQGKRTREEYERSQKRKHIKRQLRAGLLPNEIDWTGLEDQKKRIMREAELHPFAESFRRLSFREALNVYLICNKRERKMTAKILADKEDRADEDSYGYEEAKRMYDLLAGNEPYLMKAD